jgi:hypothetical protein
MTQTKIDYEARFLTLAGMPGMESLRRECPCHCHIGNNWVYGHDGNCTVSCPGWLPLPKAERLEALIWMAMGVTLIWWPDEAGDSHWEAKILGQSYGKDGPTPEAALTEVLLAAQEK